MITKYENFLNESFLSVEDRPFMKMMKDIYSRYVYKKQLSDLEFYTHFNVLLLNRRPESDSTTTENWEIKERILQDFEHVIGRTLATVRHDSLESDKILKIIKKYNGKNFEEYENIIKISLKLLSKEWDVSNPSPSSEEREAEQRQEDYFNAAGTYYPRPGRTEYDDMRDNLNELDWVEAQRTVTKFKELGCKFSIDLVTNYRIKIGSMEYVVEYNSLEKTTLIITPSGEKIKARNMRSAFDYVSKEVSKNP